MSETAESAPVASFKAEDVAGLSSEARASFIGQMVKAGFDKESIDRAMGHIPPQQTQGATTEAQDHTVNEFKHPSFSLNEQQALADNLLKHWSGDPKVLEDALRANGFEEVDDNHDTRSDLAKQFDEALGGVEPEDYDLNGIYVGRANEGPESVAVLDRDMRAALSGMEIPAELGRGIASALLDSTRNNW